MYYGELLKPPTSRGSQGAGGVGGLLKVRDKAFTVESCRGSVYYPTYDGNLNVSEYVDADGAVSAHYEQCDSILDRSGATCPKGKNRNNDCFYQYDAFGNVINSKTTGERAGDFKYKFSTKPRDAETGFYYYGYRYYDPVDGRWLNRDPIEERGGVNLYGMVLNNLMKYYDYLGRSPNAPDCCNTEAQALNSAEQAKNNAEIIYNNMRTQLSSAQDALDLANKGVSIAAGFMAVTCTSAGLSCGLCKFFPQPGCWVACGLATAGCIASSIAHNHAIQSQQSAQSTFDSTQTDFNNAETNFNQATDDYNKKLQALIDCIKNISEDCFPTCTSTSEPL